MDGSLNMISALTSIVRFSSANEELGAGLAVFPSLTEEELDRNVSLFLHPDEIRSGLSFASDVRRRSFLQGRIAVKMAVKTIFPDIISSETGSGNGSLGEPVLKNFALPYGVSLAHSETWNAGMCFPFSVPMGIDIETISEKNGPVISSVLSNHEKELCKQESDPLWFLHVLWTMKEALGKAIRLGFRVPVEWYESESIQTLTAGNQLLHLCRFKHLSMFTAITLSLPQGILSIAFPAEKNLEQAMIRLAGLKPIS